MPSQKRQRQKEREQAAKAARAAEMARARRRRNLILGGVGLVVIFALAFLYSALQGGDDDEVTTPPASETAEPGDSTDPSETTEPSETAEPDDTTGEEATTATTFPIAEPVDPECPPEDGSGERITQFTEAPPMCLEDGATYQAVFETDAGDITVDLDTETTPGATNNFVFLARWGYYDGTVFMRSNTSIDILQGGAPHTQTNSDPGPGYTIEDEGIPFTYSAGDLVYANTGQPNSSGAQFFFGTGPGVSGLDNQGTYITFGKVTEGMDVLEAIMATHVDTGGPGEGAPDPLPIIETIRIIQS